MPHRGSIDTVRRGRMLQELQENRLKVSSKFSKYSTTRAVDPWSSSTVRIGRFPNYYSLFLDKIKSHTGGLS
ncbi:hypothetical protein ILYODFUR_021514 [Ilyodon furcidens]|uniref:Uncharacterized protein n=1 Tax=Ilyodon furcidens TaxID=33524 RepID=A0ABV0T9Y1_9TELE